MTDRRSAGPLNVLRRFYIRRRFRLHSNAWGLCIGSLAMWQLPVYAFVPDAIETSSVTKLLGLGPAYAWALVYFIAGAAIFYGLIKPDSGIDAFGLALLAATVVSQLVCIAVTAPSGLVAAAPQLVTPGIAAVLRFRVVTGAVRPTPDDIGPGL